MLHVAQDAQEVESGDGKSECNTVISEAMAVLTDKDKKKLKATINNLKKEKISNTDRKQIVELFRKWLDEVKGDSPEFLQVAKALVNWHKEHIVSMEDPAHDVLYLAIELANREDVLVEDYTFCNKFVTKKHFSLHFLRLSTQSRTFSGFY